VNGPGTIWRTVGKSAGKADLDGSGIEDSKKARWFMLELLVLLGSFLKN